MKLTIIQAGDALTFVIDVVAVLPTSKAADEPQITVAPAGNIEVLQSTDLVTGSGPSPKNGQMVAIQLVAYRADTGELFAPAVALAMAIGRVGCLLTEAPGRPTSLPWGVAVDPSARRQMPHRHRERVDEPGVDGAQPNDRVCDTDREGALCLVPRQEKQIIELRLQRSRLGRHASAAGGLRTGQPSASTSWIGSASRSCSMSV